MKMGGRSECFKVHVSHTERVVAARMVQEDTIHPGRGDDDGVGGTLLFWDDQVLIGLVFPESLFDDRAESVLSDLAHQDHGTAQFFQGKSGVGDGAAGAEAGVFHIDDLSRHQELGDLVGFFRAREAGCDVYTQMSGYGDRLRFHIISILFVLC